MQYYNHIHDPVLRFWFLSEDKRVEHAKKHGVCLVRFHVTTERIEKAILDDLEENKYLYVQNKWGVPAKFLTNLKRKYNLPINLKSKAADHD